jgi:hypothetical protein
MKTVIEFPKQKALDERIEAKNPVTSKKILNIADWTPKHEGQSDTPSVDNWPFCAA